jgi:hypothetical protein
MPQVYWVKLKGKPSDETLRKVRHRAQARVINRLRAPGSAGPDAANPWYEVEVSEAPRDLLRTALFEAGHPVEKMKRVKLGPLDLGSLPEALYRQLDSKEVAQLRRAADRATAGAATTAQPASGASRTEPRDVKGHAKPKRVRFRRAKSAAKKSREFKP